jgi:hypothetical protein
MLRRFAFVLVLVLLTTPVGAQDLELFDSALAQVGMSRADVHFDYDEMAVWGGDLWRSRYFTMFHRNPFKLPKYGELNLAGLRDNADNATGLVSFAGRLIDHPIRRGLIGDQLDAYITYPDSIPVPSITRAKNILVDQKYETLRGKIDLLYRLIDDKNHFFRRSLAGEDKDSQRDHLYQYFVNNDDEYDDLVVELAAKIDMDRLLAGAQDLAEAVRRLADSLEMLPFPGSRVEMDTRHGKIVIGTAASDEYVFQQPPLLIIDGGGDDVYRFSGYPDGYPLTAIVDIGGNDRYVSSDTARPGIGGAILGAAILIDRAGNDRYEGDAIAQGTGVFGVGVLIDESGDDVYTAHFYSQAAAAFGLGILSDLDGRDSLYCWQTSQGFGYTQGAGVLINAAGNDVYVAEDDTVFDASSQSAEHNSSLAQGVGFGKRADFIDGHSWAGGVGILCDLDGDDRYSAGLFAQGCAYWFSVGMLLEGGGNDTYEGIWYVQGNGAHFGVGYLDDFAGDDSFTAEKNMAVGAGHDFTIGYLNERGGDDHYSVPNLSLGGGNANGIGIFHDHSGDDVYTTVGGTTLGRAHGSLSGPREFLATMGIFVDGGGDDTYDVPYAANGTRWIGPKSSEKSPSDYEIGVGIDR